MRRGCFTLEARKIQAKRAGKHCSRQNSPSSSGVDHSEEQEFQARGYCQNYSIESGRRSQRTRLLTTHSPGQVAPCRTQLEVARLASIPSRQYKSRGGSTARLIGTRHGIVDKKRDQRAQAAQARHCDPGYLSRKSLYRKPTTVGFARLRARAQRLRPRGGLQRVGDCGVFTIR